MELYLSAQLLPARPRQIESSGAFSVVRELLRQVGGAQLPPLDVASEWLDDPRRFGFDERIGRASGYKMNLIVHSQA